VVQRDDGRTPGGNRSPRAPSRALIFVVAGLTTFAAAGCASLGRTADASDTSGATAAAGVATGGNGTDPGCKSALNAISTYGPSTVKLVADGREAIAKAAVQLLVGGLDSAANAADSPQVKQGIQTLANAYIDYFNLTTDAVSIPLSLLLKDTADLEVLCH
jgi:hypothetical protein